MQFIMRWSELGKQVRVEPIGHNQEILSWFLKNLPTSCLQTVTVVLYDHRQGGKPQL